MVWNSAFRYLIQSFNATFHFIFTERKRFIEKLRLTVVNSFVFWIQGSHISSVHSMSLFMVCPLRRCHVPQQCEGFFSFPSLFIFFGDILWARHLRLLVRFIAAVHSISRLSSQRLHSEFD